MFMRTTTRPLKFHIAALCGAICYENQAISSGFSHKEPVYGIILNVLNDVILGSLVIMHHQIIRAINKIQGIYENIYISKLLASSNNTK